MVRFMLQLEVPLVFTDSSVHLAVFSKLSDTFPALHETTIAEVQQDLGGDPHVVDGPLISPYEKKAFSNYKDGRLFSLAKCKPGQTRGNEAVELLYGLVLDYDGPKNKEGFATGITPEHVDCIHQWLETTGFRNATYTSFTSGYCAPNQKLRVVLFFDEPVKPSEYSKIWKAVTDAIPVKIDSTSSEYSRAYYLPRVPREHLDHYDSSYGGTKLLPTRAYLSGGSAVETLDYTRAFEKHDWEHELQTTDTKHNTLVKAAFGVAASAALEGRDRDLVVEETWKICKAALELNPWPVLDWAKAEKTSRSQALIGWERGNSERVSVKGFVPTEKQLHKATQALKTAIKLVEADTTQLNNQAYMVGRYTPHVLSADHVVAALVKAAAGTHKSKYIPEPDGTLKAQGGVTAGQKHPHFTAPKDAWRAKLIIDHETGARVSCDANAAVVFREHPDMVGKLRWDVREDAALLVASPPWESTHEKFPVHINTPDGYDAARWLASEKVLGGKPLAARTVFEAMHAIAQQDKFDPFSDWLVDLKWDGTPRLDTWLSVYGGAEDSRYSRLAAKNFLIGSVALTLAPETSDVDTVLVLMGQENKGKSRLFKALAGEYFSDSLRDITDKDSYLMMQRLVILEIAELDKLMQYDDADVKSFITARKVVIRPAYGRVALPVIRRAVLCATTNESEFLKSTTGNRRFIPVPCGDLCDYKGLELVREQMWAEALHRYKNKELWWLAEEADYREAMKVQEAARVKDEIESKLDFLETGKPKGAITTLQHKNGTPLTEQGSMIVHEEQFDDHNKFLWVTVRQVCDYLSLDWVDLRIQRRVGKALRLAGWDKTQVLKLSDGSKSRIFGK